MPSPSEPPAVLSPPQPVLGDGVPAADPTLEIPPEILARIAEITVTRPEVSRLAAKDACTQRLLKKLAEAQALVMPTREKIASQKKLAAMAYQELSRLKSLRQKRAATVSM